MKKILYALFFFSVGSIFTPAYSSAKETTFEQRMKARNEAWFLKNQLREEARNTRKKSKTKKQTQKPDISDYKKRLLERREALLLKNKLKEKEQRIRRELRIKEQERIQQERTANYVQKMKVRNEALLLENQRREEEQKIRREYRAKKQERIQQEHAARYAQKLKQQNEALLLKNQLRKEERNARKEREAEEKSEKYKARQQILKNEQETGFNARERALFEDSRYPLTSLQIKCQTALEENKLFYQTSEAIKNEVWLRYPRNVFGGLALMCGAIALCKNVPKQNIPLEENFGSPGKLFGGLAITLHLLSLIRNAYAERRRDQSEQYLNQYIYLRNIIDKRLKQKQEASDF